MQECVVLGGIGKLERPPAKLPPLFSFAKCAPGARSCSLVPFCTRQLCSICFQLGASATVASPQSRAAKRDKSWAEFSRIRRRGETTKGEKRRERAIKERRKARRKMATGGNLKGGGGRGGRRAGGGRRGGRAGQGARKRRRRSASSLGNSRRKDTNLPEMVKSHQFKKQSLQIVDSDKILIDGSGRHLTSRVHRVAT